MASASEINTNMNEMQPIYEIQEEQEDREEVINTNRHMMGAERMITEYDEEFDTVVISFEISKYLEYAITVLVSLVLLQLQFILHFELMICLIPVLLIEVRSLFLHSIRLKSISNYQEGEIDKVTEIKSLISSLANFLFFASLIFIHYNHSYFIITSVPLFFDFLVDFLIKKRASNQCQLFSIICQSIAKLFKVILIACICIKIDHLAKWSWASALWPLWLVLACLSVLSIGAFLLMIVSIFSYYYSDPSTTELFSSVWFFYTSAGACLVLFLFGLDVVEEKYEKMPLYGISYLTIFICVTFLLRFHLQKWWKSFFFEDGHISIPSLSNSGPLPLPPSQAQHMKLSTKIIRAIKLPPRALVRLSSTYFQPASPKEPAKVVRTMSHDVKENSTRENVHFRSLSSLPKENHLGHKISADLSFVDKKCGICMNEECNSVFLECGHGGICHNCATFLMDTKRQCHMCRSTITQVVKIKVEPGKVLKVIGTKTN